MINTVYSLLMKGRDASGPYARYVDPDSKKISYNNTFASAFIPAGDPEYMAYCADQLASICARSPLKTEMLAVDPTNTYEFEFAPSPVVTSIVAPAGYSVQLLESSLNKEWISRSYPVAVNNIAGTISIATLGISSTYTWAGNLSSIVDTGEGVKFRISGPTPATTFGFDINLERSPYRNISTLPFILRNSGIIQMPLYVENIKDPDINVALPAMVLNYCNGLIT